MAALRAAVRPCFRATCARLRITNPATIRRTPFAHLLIIQPVAPRRSLTSGSRLFDEGASDHVATTPPKHASTKPPGPILAVLNISKGATRAELVEFLQSNGVEIKRLKYPVNRFSLRSSGVAFVELASEEEASKALETLHKSEFSNRKLRVEYVRQDFEWGDGRIARTAFPTNLNFDDQETREIFRPLLERRSVAINVLAPGWSHINDAPGSRHEVMNELLIRHFGKYGVERSGHLGAITRWSSQEGRLVCLMEFETKEGADQAIAELHNTQVEGATIQVRPRTLIGSPYHQLGKIDMALREELEAQGLAKNVVPTEKHQASL